MPPFGGICLGFLVPPDGVTTARMNQKIKVTTVLCTQHLKYFVKNHQAELATFAIETELVRRDEGFAPNDISQILPLQILRAIATTPVSLNYAMKSGDVGLVWF